MNGQVSTLLVFNDSNNESDFSPVLQALTEQAERIENLEAQNRDLLRREELLISLMELTNKTGELMAQNLRAIERLETNLHSTDKSDTATES